MSVGEVFKWALMIVLALLLWSWFRRGVTASVGPYGTGNGYPIGGQPGMGGGSLSGWIPFAGGKNGGITFGANVPWNVGPYLPLPVAQPVGGPIGWDYGNN